MRLRPNRASARRRPRPMSAVRCRSWGRVTAPSWLSWPTRLAWWPRDFVPPESLTAHAWVVRARGLEPPWLAPHGPKPCACTSSATPAAQREIYPRKMLAVSSLDVAATINDAIAAGAAVVALESAVITHGLPKAAAMEAVARQWDACTKGGASPAVVAVFEGRLRVGLSLEECATLAGRPDAVKVSPWNLGAALISPGFGGTTVAATIAAAAKAGIRIVSTGGIGGVHPGDGHDVSADLTELSRQPVCVVCAGPKSTLDATATLERLETLGVPVIGWRSSVLAGFLATAAGLRLPARADSVDELATILQRHWDLGGAGAVVSQPLPVDLAIPLHELAVDDPAAHGPARTPAELRQLQARLGERVIRANVAPLAPNAPPASPLAGALGPAQPAPEAAPARFPAKRGTS